MATTDAGQAQDAPDIQLFCNLVIRNGERLVMLVKPDPADERWWLPWADIEPYQHPDDAVDDALKKMTGLVVSRRALAQVESFRGRRGWHVTFDYLVEASGDPPRDQAGAWFPADDLPRTNHGEWERRVVRDVIAKASAGLTGAARG